MFSEVEHDRVEARVGELMGVINSSTAELVSLLADAMVNETWSVAGMRSPEHWVTWQCGVSHARATQLVRIARRRAELPRTSALFDAGQLTEDAMAAIARRTPADRDAEVAELAPALLHSQLTRWLGSLPRPEPEPGVDPEGEPERREVSFGSDGDRWKLRADLPADEGALVEKALTAGRSSVFHDRHPDVEVENPRTSNVTWADGLCRMTEAALVGLGRLGDRRPADRHQLLLHLNASGPDGIAQLHLGPVVPDCLRRFLTCDSDVRAIIEDDGVLLALSKRLRIVDDQMRAFVEQRDGGCIVPGCLQRRWLHMHHIVHWEDRGPTETPNLCALCPLHHRMHHLGLLAIEGDPSRPGGLTVRDRHGYVIGARPPSPRARPPDVSPFNPYTHPSGEKVDWQWVDWQDLNQRRHDTS